MMDTYFLVVKPNITLLNPDTQYRSAGQEAYIRCSFNAVPSANVTWRFDGSRDIAGKYTTHGNTSVLHLRKVRRKDTGYYTCSAANRAGIDEQRAYIKVMCKYFDVDFCRLHLGY